MTDLARIDRAFWPIAAVLLAIMGVVQVTSALQETQTWDEGGHLAAGYAYLKTGRIGPYTDHPPLRALCALPLLALNARLPIDHPSWQTGDKVLFATMFMYANRYHPDTLLMAGRSVTIALTLVLAAVLAWWAKRRLGPAPALFAVLLFTCDPNFIAHGRYITTDLLFALCFFLAVVAWGAYLERPGWRTLLCAGVALGLALVSKFSGVLLLPIFALLCPIRRPMRSLLSLGAVAMIGVLVVAAAYGPETLRMTSVATHPYVVGLKEVAEHSRSGHESYLLGMCSTRGWWYYFPVVFAVKTPLAVLAVTLLCLWGRLKAWLKACPTGVWWLLVVPIVVYFLASTTTAINLGVRHLLPVYPLLFVLGSAAVFRLGKAAPYVALALALLEVGESVRIYPHHLAFFNTAVGGPAAGPRYLLDSNIDWGQDVKKLRSYLQARGIKEVCMFYFGNTGVEFYGIPMLELPRTWETEKRANMNCVAAISVTNLYDLYVPQGSYQWLRELKPMAKVGWSIYVYDLRKQR